MWNAYKNDLKQHLLVDLHELLVPFLDVGGLLARVGIVLLTSWWIGLVVLAPLENLLKYGLVDLCDIRGNDNHVEGEVQLTFGIGIGVSATASPMSSAIFAMRMERVATSRAVRCESCTYNVASFTHQL